MAKKDLNPYAAPSTPSDEISNRPNLAEKGIYVTGTEAFRMGGLSSAHQISTLPLSASEAEPQ